MAVAEKAVTEKSPRTPQQLLPMASLFGALYLLVALGVVFTGLPWVWNHVLQVGEYLNEFLSAALMLIAAVAVAAGLIYVGIKLERNPPRGFRAGTFFLSLSLLVIFWITMKAGVILASQFEFIVGVVLMAAIAGGLLFLVFWLFSRPDFCGWLVKVEDQGWFHARSYKGNQGLRVRRGTMVAILTVGFCGIFSMLTGSGLTGRQGSNTWSIELPYSQPVLGATTKTQNDRLVVARVEPDSPAARGGMQPGDEIIEIEKKEVSDKNDLATILDTKSPGSNVHMKVNRDVNREVKTEDVTVTLGASTIPIVYNVHVILPLLLSVLLVWFAWRVVHLPVFADFLIATEAEMNKVSWTTRRRLVQDTIVVLVTVVLMAGFLFAVDVLWIKVLGAVRVLQVDIRAEHQKQQEKSQW